VPNYIALLAALIAKKKGTRLYYYYVVESARVDGQPRNVHQTYLGTADKVAALVQNRTSPVPLRPPRATSGPPARCGWPTSKPVCGRCWRHSGPHLDPLATGEDGPLDLAQLLLLDLWKSQQMVSRHLLAYDTTSFYTYIASNMITYESPTMHPESSGLHLRMGPFPGNLTLSSPGSGWS